MASSDGWPQVHICSTSYQSFGWQCFPSILCLLRIKLREQLIGVIGKRWLPAQIHDPNALAPLLELRLITCIRTWNVRIHNNMQIVSQLWVYVEKESRKRIRYEMNGRGDPPVCSSTNAHAQAGSSFPHNRLRLEPNAQSASSRLHI